MVDQMTFRVRVFFQKKGRLAMLSHLEVARSLERAIRRAHLPYAISQGFSPHMKIAFGAALPVGVGGLRECFDLQLTRYVDPREVLAALTAASVDDLMVFDCVSLGPREPAASVAFPVSVYCVELSAPLSKEVSLPTELTVIRKKKEKTVIVSDYLLDDVEREGCLLHFSLLARPTGSMRPDKFIQALIEKTADLRVISITRVDQQTTYK